MAWFWVFFSQQVLFGLGNLLPQFQPMKVNKLRSAFSIMRRSCLSGSTQLLKVPWNMTLHSRSQLEKRGKKLATVICRRRPVL